MNLFPRSTRALARTARLLSRVAVPFSMLLLLCLPGAAGAQTTYTGSGFTINSSGSQTTNINGTSSISVSNSATVSNVAVTLNGLYVNEATWSSYSLAGTSFVLAYCPTSGTCREYMLLGSTGDAFGGGTADNFGSGVNVTIKDSASSLAPGCSTYLESNCPAWNSSPSSQSYKPSSYWMDNNGLSSVPSNSALGLPSPYSGYTLSFPPEDGSQTLNNEFSVSGAGTWTLIIADDTNVATTPVTISSWSLVLTFATAPSTTTSLSSSNNPSFATSPNNSVTFTANVTSTSTVNSGTVEFFANGSAISGCTSQVVSNGVATCTTTGVSTQGLNQITASYTGTGAFANSSSGTVNQIVIQHPTGSTSSNHWCVSSGFTIPGGGGTSTVYPSVIQVSGYPSGTTVTNVKVTLNGLYGDVDAQHLLVSPTNTYNLDFFDGSWYTHSVASSSAVSPVFYDSAGAYPTWGGTPDSGNYEASDQLETPQLDTFSSSTAASVTSSATTPIPQVPGTIIYGYNSQFPSERGAITNTFEYAFNGAPANGDWALYGYQQNDTASETVGSWCVDLTISTANSTTTKLSTDQNPHTVGTSATLTATVKSGSSAASGGTVTFLDAGVTPLADSGSGNSLSTTSLGAAGTATYTTGKAYYSIYNGSGNTKIYEGDHNFTAEYSGSTIDNPSNSTVFWQRFDDASTVSMTDNTHYSYCNSGAILTRANTLGAWIPNPSNVFVSNLPGIVNTVGVTLKSLFTTGDTSADTQSMVAGPTGAALDFFSNNTGGSPSSFSTGNYTFADSGTTLPTGSTFTANTYAPRAAGTCSDTFTSSSSVDTSNNALYKIPTTWGYATPCGSATFTSTFGNTLGNGTWSLFFNLSSLSGTTGATGGWCANFTQNAVSITPTLSHTGTGTGGDFVQGEQNAQITVSVATGSSTGSTGDPTGTNPLTVADTLPTGLTYASGSGTNWTCGATGQTVTCTNDSSIAQSSAYPTLTIDVNVASNASSSMTNKVAVSGAGAQSANASDPFTVLATTTTAVNNESTSYSASSQSVTLGAKVTSGATNVNEGSVTFGIYQGSTLIGTGATTTTVSGGVFTTSYTVPAGTAAGTYSIHASFSGDANYSSSSNNTATFTINAITPTMTWTPVSTIIFGDAGTGVLNASVNCTSCGNISYTATPSGGSSSAITTTSGLAAGTYTIAATFTPSSGNYNTVSASKSLTVSGQSTWIVNGSGGTAELAGNGYAITSSVYGGANAAVAIDANGNVWTVGTGETLLKATSQTGIVQYSLASGGGLNSPSALAIDGNGEVWITNPGNASVSLFLNTGTASSPSSGFTDSSLSNPSGVAVDLGGSVWVANQGNNSMTRFLGAGAPAAPLSTAAADKTTGARP